MKALEKDRARRYVSADAFAADVERHLHDEPVQASPPSRMYRLQKYVRRHRVGVIAGTLVAAALIVGLSAAVWGFLDASGQRDHAIKAEREATAATNTTATALVRAEAGETAARDSERLATQKANDVLSLSASKDLEELVARADKLWPAGPEMIPEYEKWLAEAKLLIDGRPAGHDSKKRSSLEEHKAKLAELRQRATKQSAAEVQADRESHPRFEELTKQRAALTWQSRMLGLEPWPIEADVEAQLAKETLPSDADELYELVWPLVRPDQPLYGEEVKGLLLAKRAVAAATDAQRAGIRDCLAWANLQLGRLDEAVAEEERAFDEAPANEAKKYEGYIAKMEKAVASWRGAAVLADRRKERDALLAEVSDLDRVVSERRTWTFENQEDAWWQVQLSKLVSNLEALRDSKTGLMGDTLAEPFGWGMTKRYEFARTIKERSTDGSEAKRRWSEAIAALAVSPKYGGLKLTPQVGLLPIGEDPESHLWEFAHVQTGEPAMRGSDGKLVLAEVTGLVFVLIPGGTYWMGAQSTEPTGRNFDPGSGSDESPVHQVALSSYFLSKYEMTQGQWQRIGARNPSLLDCSKASPVRNRALPFGTVIERVCATGAPKSTIVERNQTLPSWPEVTSNDGSSMNGWPTTECSNPIFHERADHSA